MTIFKMWFTPGYRYHALRIKLSCSFTEESSILRGGLLLLFLTLLGFLLLCVAAVNASKQGTSHVVGGERNNVRKTARGKAENRVA